MCKEMVDIKNAAVKDKLLDLKEWLTGNVIVSLLLLTSDSWRLRRQESRRSLRSALSRRLAPEQGTSPVGSFVKPSACRPLRW